MAVLNGAMAWLFIRTDNLSRSELLCRDIIKGKSYGKLFWGERMAEIVLDKKDHIHFYRVSLLGPGDYRGFFPCAPHNAFFAPSSFLLYEKLQAHVPVADS